MKVVFLVLFAAALAQAKDEIILQLTWGPIGLFADKSYFFKIPTTLSSAQDQEWGLTTAPEGLLSDLQFACTQGRTVCLYYDGSGLVAAIQLAFAIEDYTTAPDYHPEKRFVKWTAPATDTEPEKDYWTLTQLFASVETLKAGNRDPAKGILQDGGVWITGPDGNLLKISTKESDIASETAFTRQNCIPGMGTHYFYNYTTSLDCDELFPWFSLVKSGELVASGITVVGTLKDQPKWWENPPKDKTGLSILIALAFYATSSYQTLVGQSGFHNVSQTTVSRAVREFIVPLAPDCLFDWTSQYGIFTMHLYYVDKPWWILCRPSDSVSGIIG